MSQLAPLKNVQPVWVTDFWDGPLNGLALYEGRCHWFEVESFDPDHPPEIRKYILYPLTDDEIVAEEALHDLFRKHVGTHTDWDVRGRQTPLSARRLNMPPSMTPLRPNATVTTPLAPPLGGSG